ncbi:MAG: alpha-galactosidase [Proteobacteria bacterium]|nr:alpha-galactosidase [Pseudomonadota bacterium]
MITWNRALLAITPLLLGCPSEEPPLPCAGERAEAWDGANLTMTAEGCASLDLRARLLGEGGLEVDFELRDGAWVPTVTSASGGTFTGLVLEGAWETAGAEAAVLWRQGYQSWSYSGVIGLEELSLDADGVPEVGGDGDARTVIEEKAGTSWWVGLVGRPDGASLLLGAQGALRTKLFVAFDQDTAWAVWGHRGEAIEIAAGGSLELDPLVIGAGEDAWALHGSYADAAAERVSPRPLPGAPPVGWATWYYYFEDITEATVRANLEAAQTADGEPVTLFQIDDGWQQVWGDWTADDGFPSGMAALAGDISAAGLTPGLWMAPLYVDRSTLTYQEHADWWVRDADGEELVFTNINTGDYAVLDPTHPDAAAWLAQTIRDRVEEGWEYFKFDFLYAGAQEGQRHEDVTGTEAYHRAMEILREAAGDAWILACGAPLLPSLGYAESFRTGADIGFSFDRRPQRAYVRWQARASAGRGWSNGRWWWIDPDQIMVRDPFTEAEATGAVTANAISGGTWMLGDDLPTLDPARLELALNPALTRLRGETPVPEDPLTFVSGLDAGPILELAENNDQVPTTWRFDDGTVVLLNMTEAFLTLPGPGGTELISGETSGEGNRVLEPGAGEVWAP